MLDIGLIPKKSLFKKENGEALLDLTSVVHSYDNVRITKGQRVLVSEDQVMRPDLIAFKYYGDDGKLDYVLKFNNISNPFSLDKNEILLIPNSDEISLAFFNAAAEGDKGFSNNVLNPLKFNKKDKKRLDYLKDKAKKPVLPSNVAPEGYKEFETKDGKIVFGGVECEEPISKAKLKSKLIANKIFGNS